jgi:membrane protein insertase Oxa1/YidC/SpoIIIJ
MVGSISMIIHCQVILKGGIFTFQVLKFGLSTLHVPNAYGFSIVMLAVLVNAAIFPLTRKQVCCFRVVFVSLFLNSLI